jgi:phage host-nuclease inhibitor protein Gam
MSNTTVPTPQAVTAWKGKADKLAALDAEITTLQTKLEAKLKPIREQFEPDIQAKLKDLKKLAAEVQSFGIEHSDTLFADGSEIRTKVAIITGKKTPGAVSLEDGFSEKEVIEAMKADRTLKQYLDVKYALAKAAIKKVFSNGGGHAEALGLAGLTLAEGFSVTVKGKGD